MACAAVALAVACGTASARAATHTWAAYEIGPMEPGCPPDSCDDDIYGNDINASGWVAGDAFPDFHWPWVWKEAANPTLLSPGHTAFPGFDDSGFLAINSAGDTAGYTYNLNSGGNEEHAVLYRAGAFTDLGTLQGGAGFAVADGINDSDTVVGGSTIASGAHHAFVWTSATGMHDLGTLGGAESWANAVNGGNAIVGRADTRAGRQHAFLAQNGHMTDLGTLGGATSEATSINGNGVIVGWAQTASGAKHAFVRTGSTMTDIGKLLNATASVANDVDRNGDVVGTADTPSGQFAWLYTGGSMVDIGRRTITCCEVVGGALNKTLQIVPRALSSWTVPVLEPITAYDETAAAIHYTGAWTRRASSGSWGGHVKSATAAGASAALTFTGRRVWWIAPEGAGYGRARVLVDGVLKATVDLGAAPDGVRRTAYVQAFSAVGKHTIKVVVAGTAGRPKVAVDVFGVSQR
jgi:probable HAF family extracellular repeat protein